MRIVLDENLPATLKGIFLPPHVATTVQELGLSGVANGELLDQLDGQFDTFVTADSPRIDCRSSRPCLRKSFKR